MARKYRKSAKFWHICGWLAAFVALAGATERRQSLGRQSTAQAGGSTRRASGRGRRQSTARRDPDQPPIIRRQDTGSSPSKAPTKAISNKSEPATSAKSSSRRPSGVSTRSRANRSQRHHLLAPTGGGGGGGSAAVVRSPSSIGLSRDFGTGKSAKINQVFNVPKLDHALKIIFKLDHNRDAYQLYQHVTASRRLPLFESFPKHIRWSDRFADYAPADDLPASIRRVEEVAVLFFRRFGEFRTPCVLKCARLVSENECVPLVNELDVLPRFNGDKHVIQFYHAFIDDVPNRDASLEPHLCLVLEYIDGGDLLSAHEANQLDEDGLRPIVRDVVRGLNAFHNAGFMHSDVKLNNIMFQNTPKGRIAKVIDAGASYKMLGSNALRTYLAGTENYLSPEALIDQKMNYASDWWSLGITLYVALTGKFPAETGELLQAKDLPDDRKKALEKEYLEKYRTLQELNDAQITGLGRSFVRDLLQVDWRRRLGVAGSRKPPPLEHKWLQDRTYKAEADALRKAREVESRKPRRR